MATATQTDDELIILEDDTSVSKEEVIDFGAEQTAETIVTEETPVSNELNLEAIASTEDSPEIVNLGETLEETSDASDLFNVDAEEKQDEVVDLFAEDATEVSETANIDLATEEKTEEISVESDTLITEEKQDEVVDLFGEAELETETTEEVASEETVLEDTLALEENTLEAESDIFGGDDTSAQDDSQAGDDTAASDDSMNTILAATIAKLEARKEVIIKDKETDKAQISDRKAQIKELEAEIAEFDETISELTAEQRKITTNVKSLEKMKLAEDQAAA